MKSSLTGQEISESQYLVEMVCERYAKQNKLPWVPKFWRLEVWIKFYKLQLIAVNGLLKLYDYKAILSALEKHKNAYSLKAKFLLDTIAVEHSKIQMAEKVLESQKTEKESVGETKLTFNVYNKKTKNLGSILDE